MSRVPRIVVITLFVLGLAVLGALVWRPVVTWRQLGDARREVTAELDAAREQNAQHEDELDRITDPANIERRAREDFGLVRPGEEVYTVVPVDVSSLELPEHWPFGVIAEDVLAFASRR